jgi:hypothetical protein
VSIDTVVSFSKLVELVRNSVIEILSHKSGLQLKRSRRKGHIYYRLRAPIRLLEQHAINIGYRLQLKPEVDPGPEFWSSEEEVMEEMTEVSDAAGRCKKAGAGSELDSDPAGTVRQYSRDKAEEILEELFHVGKITPNDLTIFEDEVHEKQWSRRIHTLERIADKVPVTNRYPAYTSFLSDGKLRHLFQSYQSVRGRTLFRSKDRLFLTRSILQSHIDFAMLECRGIIKGITALHDASRGERVNSDMLVRRWVSPWREHLDKIGAPCVSDEANDEGKRPFPLLVPWSQPLDDVREYFGEKIAMYFAWLGFYAWALIVPAIVGIGLQVYQGYLGADYTGLDWAQVGVAVFICLWSTIYKKAWDRELRAVSLKWGMDGTEEAEKNRPQFVGDSDDANQGRRRSPVTNRLETYYPEWKRNLKQIASFAVILTAVGVVGGLIELLMWSWDKLESDNFPFAEWLISFVFALEIRILSYFYEDVARSLNDWENHQTETSYEDSLIYKTFFFQIVNNYGALVYVAFIKGSVYGCWSNPDNSMDCMGELEVLFIVIFLVRMANGFIEIGYPILRRHWRDSGEDSGDDDASTSSGGSIHSAEEGSQSAIAVEDFEAEVALPPYEGTFGDYAQIILQYGYVTMFILAFPVASALVSAVVCVVHASRVSVCAEPARVVVCAVLCRRCSRTWCRCGRMPTRS